MQLPLKGIKLATLALQSRPRTTRLFGRQNDDYDSELHLDLLLPIFQNGGGYKAYR